MTYKMPTNYQLCHDEPNSCPRRIQRRTLSVLFLIIIIMNAGEKMVQERSGLKILPPEGLAD